MSTERLFQPNPIQKAYLKQNHNLKTMQYVLQFITIFTRWAQFLEFEDA